MKKLHMTLVGFRKLWLWALLASGTILLAGSGLACQTAGLPTGTPYQINPQLIGEWQTQLPVLNGGICDPPVTTGTLVFAADGTGTATNLVLCGDVPMTWSMSGMDQATMEFPAVGTGQATATLSATGDTLTVAQQGGSELTFTKQ